MLILQILGAWAVASIILAGGLSWGATRLKRCKHGNKVETPVKNWTVLEWEYEDDGTQEMHVLPNNDHIVHEIPGDHCPCGANWTRYNGVSIYRHASLDGRERHE